MAVRSFPYTWLRLSEAKFAGSSLVKTAISNDLSLGSVPLCVDFTHPQLRKPTERRNSLTEPNAGQPNEWNRLFIPTCNPATCNLSSLTTAN